MTKPPLHRLSSHRIDRNTGGIVMAAKNAETLRIMNQKVRDRELVKLYLCIACGHMEKREATLTGYLKRTRVRTASTSRRSPPPGQKASRRATACCRKRSGSACSRWSCHGRTHQSARTWLPSATRWPGRKYGSNALNRETGFRYQALCSYKLRFRFTRRPAFWTAQRAGIHARDVWFLKDFEAWIK